MQLMIAKSAYDRIKPRLDQVAPNLDIVTVAVKPSGLTLIRNLDSANTVLDERYNEALERFGSIGFDSIDGRHDEVLHVVPNHWDAIEPHLPRHPYATAGSSPAASASPPPTPSTPRGT